MATMPNKERMGIRNTMTEGPRTYTADHRMSSSNCNQDDEEVNIF